MKKSTLRLLLILVPLVALGLYFLLKKPSGKSNQENVIVKVTEAPLIVTIHAPANCRPASPKK
jgi:hypothetical protein